MLEITKDEYDFINTYFKAFVYFFKAEPYIEYKIDFIKTDKFLNQLDHLLKKIESECGKIACYLVFPYNLAIIDNKYYIK